MPTTDQGLQPITLLATAQQVLVTSRIPAQTLVNHAAEGAQPGKLIRLGRHRVDHASDGRLFKLATHVNRAVPYKRAIAQTDVTEAR